MPASKSWAYAALGLGVLVVSSSSILVRYAQGAGVPSLSIAALRLALAALLLTPLALARASGEIRGLSRRDLHLALLAGGLLAAHFATWISSLAYTSVASSTVLVTTNPIWIALASMLIFHERMGKGMVVAIGMALGGSALIFFADGGGGGGGTGEGMVQPNPLLGNSLALLGALSVSGYFLIGRALRRRLSLLAFIWLIYTSCAMALIAVALIADAPLRGFSAAGWACLLGLALGPQLLGHSVFNWALKHVSATFIALTILGEPIGASLLALLLFGERLSPLQSAGFATLLVGIYLAARSEKSAGEPGAARD